MADLKRYEELVVITKTYDLILWSCNCTFRDFLTVQTP